MEDRTELTFICELVDLNNTDNFCHYIKFVITNSVTPKLFPLICALPQFNFYIR